MAARVIPSSNDWSSLLLPTLIPPDVPCWPTTFPSSPFTSCSPLCSSGSLTISNLVSLLCSSYSLWSPTSRSVSSPWPLVSRRTGVQPRELVLVLLLLVVVTVSAPSCLPLCCKGALMSAEAYDRKDFTPLVAGSQRSTINKSSALWTGSHWNLASGTWHWETPLEGVWLLLLPISCTWLWGRWIASQCPLLHCSVVSSRTSEIQSTASPTLWHCTCCCRPGTVTWLSRDPVPSMWASARPETCKQHQRAVWSSDRWGLQGTHTHTKIVSNLCHTLYLKYTSTSTTEQIRVIHPKNAFPCMQAINAILQLLHNGSILNITPVYWKR